MRAWLLLVLLLMSGCAAPGEVEKKEWHGFDLDAVEPAWKNDTLPPGKGVEMNFALREGELLEWQWFDEERKPLPFSIHTHAYFDPKPLYKIDAARDSNNLTIARPGSYSMVWENHGELPVTLWVRTRAPSDAYFFPLN